jgi:exopolysaccharide production protein ExoZ
MGMIRTSELKTIQYLRGIAALMVVYAHFLGLLKRHGSGSLGLDRFRIGDSGVDIFFVISGLIMVVTSAIKPVSPAQFLQRRIQRIVPTYWFYSTLMVIAVLAVPGLLNTAQFDLEHVVKSFLFIPEYHPRITNSIWPILVQGWTLNYEMFFYLLFAVSLLIPRQGLRIAALVAVLAALVATGRIAAFTSPIALTWTSQLLLEFAAGCLLGYFWVRFPRLYRMPVWLLCLLAVAAIGMFLLSNGLWHWTGHRALGTGIPATLLVATALGVERTCHFPDLRLLHRIGDSSYSIYLSHTFVLAGMGLLWSRVGVNSAILDLCALIAAMVGCSLFGYLSWRLVEVRSLRLLRSFM